ncbi:MAG: glycosyltransferase family 4 protein [Gemmatimonadaceae bacterium]
MPLFVSSVVALFIAAVTGELTRRFRRYALKRGLMDVPNSRSSHETPTPRGGGVAIVITVLALLALISTTSDQYSGHNDFKRTMSLMASGFVAAAIGYADDHGGTPVLTRLGAHFAAAAFAIVATGTAPIAHELQLPLSLSFIAPIVALFYLVWMLNLTNFMDGIDGLASVQTITVCLGGLFCVLLYQHLHASPADIPPMHVDYNALIAKALPFIVGASTVGFLFWNWPPARIFMGDAGSGFLGIMLGAMSLAAAAFAPHLLWSWLILLGAFITDATVTLFRRIIRREQFYQAHRSHAYQHAARRWGHQKVTIAFGAVNLLWLTPLALAVATMRLNAFTALTIAYAPLVCAAFLLKAGTPE